MKKKETKKVAPKKVVKKAKKEETPLQDFELVVGKRSVKLIRRGKVVKSFRSIEEALAELSK